MADLASVQPSAPAITPLKRFWRLLKVERKDIVNIAIFAVVAGVINLSLPLGIQAIFNYVSGGEVTTSWVILVVVVILGVVANGILQIFQVSITERLQQRIFTHSALEFAYRIPRLKMDALRQQVAPELVNRFFDTLTVQKSLSKLIMDLSASVLQIIFGLLLLSFYHSFFIVFAILLVALIFVVLRITGPAGLRTSLEESKYKYKVAFWLEEMARVLESFKFAGNTHLPLDRTDNLTESYLKARRNHFRVLLANYGMFLVFKVLIIGSLLIVGSILVFNNALNMGQFVAMEIVVILSLSAVDKLILTTETMYDILTALEKLGTLTDLPLESEQGERMDRAPGTQGMAINIKDLTLRFPDMRHPVVSHAYMTVRPGERVNLITTDDSFITHFFRLLTGFYDGYKGSITINDMPLQNLCLEDLRLHVGGYSTLQEIFDGTLLENVTMGLDGASLDRVLPILRAVGLTEFVEGEQEGLHTHLQTHGGTLPESIKRKIILARSLAGHPSLLLLNQPFDGLEAVDRKGFLNYVKEHLPYTTMIIATPDPLEDNLADKAYRIVDHTVVAA